MRQEINRETKGKRQKAKKIINMFKGNYQKDQQSNDMGKNMKGKCVIQFLKSN